MRVMMYRPDRKVGLGLGVIGGYRGIPSSPVPLADRVVSARNSAIPVSSSSINSNQQIRNSTVSISSHHYDSTFSVNDWDFISEHYHDDERIIHDLMDDPSSTTRFVFGPVPSLEEAKSATSDLKDALEKIYFSPGGTAAASVGYGSSTSVHRSGLLPRPLEAYFSNDRTVTFSSEPKTAFLAFSLLRDSPDVQNVVASLASDKNVWEAVMKNEELMEFYKKANENVSVSTPGVEVERKPKDGIISFGSSANGLIGLMDMIKEKVLAMVSSVLEYIQNIFRNQAEGRDSGNSIWKCTSTGAPFMALTIAAIMVVMVKRA
ncbi:hypothetical protein BVC80_1835g134 [Macleaya cordata]|uniref:Uncharacterized protein n=1 Tax=Macleaya cordata TaxID=56857 RepID=A0A200R4X3_MACCD|nr:hypothetical protein BVC80_1835g134 [Macleaya cordata]